MCETKEDLLRSYVFVTTEPGMTRTAARGISDLELSGCRISTVEQVIGGCDIIVKLETVDLDSLARVISDGIREVDGVLDVVASWCLDQHDAHEAQPSGRPLRSLVSVIDASGPDQVPRAVHMEPGGSYLRKGPGN